MLNAINGSFSKHFLSQAKCQKTQKKEPPKISKSGQTYFDKLILIEKQTNTE